MRKSENPTTEIRRSQGPGVNHVIQHPKAQTNVDHLKAYCTNLYCEF